MSKGTKLYLIVCYNKDSWKFVPEEYTD